MGLRDTNFFEPYIEKKEFDFKGKGMIIFVVTGIIVILLILSPIVNMIRISKMNKEIIKIEDELNSTQNKVKKESFENKRQEIIELKDKEETLDLIAGDFYKRDNVGDFLVHSITDSMTGTMFLKNMDINGDEIVVSGIAKEKADIARLERNFRRIIYFNDVFIPSIKLNEDFYEFSVNIKINNEEVNLKKQQQLEEVNSDIEEEEVQQKNETE